MSSNDLFKIYDSVHYVANIRYRDYKPRFSDINFDNIVRIIIASVENRNEVFHIENPSFINKIAKGYRPNVGIPNSVAYWFESVQMNHYQELERRGGIVSVSDSSLISIAVEADSDFLFLSNVCKVRTVKVYDHVFIVEDGWPDDTEDERKLQNTKTYRADPNLTRQTFILARKLEKLRMRKF